LGDAVLELVVTEHCFARFPDLDEGSLSKLRSGVVSEVALANAATEMGIGQHLALGKGEERTGGRRKPAILADAFEALLGAVYLDGGLDAARGVVVRHLGDQIATIAEAPRREDVKSLLQEVVVRDGASSPVYEVVGSGPDHDRSFLATVTVDGRMLGSGSGRSKKSAEQAAAARALEEWNRA
jgi:ribonuclease-3